MGPEIATKLMTPPTEHGASPLGKEGAGGGADKAAEFQKHLQGAKDDPSAANQVGAVQQNNQVNNVTIDLRDSDNDAVFLANGSNSIAALIPSLRAKPESAP